jgi:hypothetical protein
MPTETRDQTFEVQTQKGCEYLLLIVLIYTVFLYLVWNSDYTRMSRKGFFMVSGYIAHWLSTSVCDSIPLLTSKCTVLLFYIIGISGKQAGEGSCRGEKNDNAT